MQTSLGAMRKMPLKIGPWPLKIRGAAPNVAAKKFTLSIWYFRRHSYVAAQQSCLELADHVRCMAHSCENRHDALLLPPTKAGGRGVACLEGSV